MTVIFDQVAIFGVGLIGGSLGMALKKHGLANQVIGFDVDQENIELAIELQAIDQGYINIQESLLSKVDLVVLAAPITVNVEILKTIKPYLKPGVVITDVGSTKAEFVAECEALLGSDYFFVGGHPMAGAEIAGVKGADPYLFENAIYILTPTKLANKKATAQLQDLFQQVGARVMLIDPDEHDFVVAAISHLPHLVASTLVNAVAEIERQHPLSLVLAAGGFRDTTRIASGDPELWKDICFSNKEKLLKVIEIFKEQLTLFEEQLELGAVEEFKGNLELAKEVRAKIPAKMKGYWPFLDEIIVTIPDRPGTIGQVAAILGEQGINIDDIEILRVREGEGGSLRLGFASLGSADKAIEILGKHQLLARKRPGS